MIKKIALISAFSYSLYAGNLIDLIEQSIENKIVQSSNQELESTKLEYSSLKSSYLPSIYVGSNLSKTSEETALVPDKGINAYAQLKYNIYDGGAKQHKYDTYESKIKGQNFDIEGLKNRISLDVITYYYSYLSLMAQKKSKEQEILELKEEYRKKQRLLEAQTVAIDEVDKILSRLETSTVSLHEIELDMQRVLHNLEYIIGKKINIEEGSIITSFESKDKEILADLRALEYEMQTILSRAKSEKSSIYPQIDLDNTFTHYESDYDSSTYEDSSVDNQNIISLNLSWKLYDFDSTNKKYEADYKKYLSLKSKYEYEKDRIDTQLRLAYRAYDISLLKIDSAKTGLKAANSTFKSVKAKFDNSIIDNVAYLEALSEKYDALSLLQSALFDLEIKRANIIYLSGKDLVDYIN